MSADRTVRQLSGVGVWSTALRFADPNDSAAAASELEDLGYTALWFPDAGGDVFAAVENLLQPTRNIVVCTGILNLWMHSASETVDAFARFKRTYGSHRYLVGIGISHAPTVEASQQRYDRPLARTSDFLDELDGAPEPVGAEDRVLAALRPKMLELARDRSSGAHTYLVTPQHTELARRILGPDKLLLVEQAVSLETDPAAARAAGRSHLEAYLPLPNYTNNWKRLGFTEDDLSAGGSDRLVDALVAWGDESAVTAHVQEHFVAGADHVCIQVVGGALNVCPREEWQRLAPVLVKPAP
jgi:probable F420-dependent oxidoreductase